MRDLQAQKKGSIEWCSYGVPQGGSTSLCRINALEADAAGAASAGKEARVAVDAEAQPLGVDAVAQRSQAPREACWVRLQVAGAVARGRVLRRARELARVRQQRSADKGSMTKRSSRPGRKKMGPVEARQGDQGEARASNTLHG